MRASTTALLGLLLMLPLAGCLSGDPTNDRTNGHERAMGFQEGRWPDGQAARDLIESYIMTHPFRVEQTGFEPYMAAARDDLAAHLQAIEGLHVVRDDYDGGQNILAMRNGTTHPDSWVVLSAHYDSVGVGGIGPTVYGAWDDGSGTALLMEMAAAFSTWDFPFTVVFAFFDGEEKGLVGSTRFVEKYYGDGTHELLANLNTDPPGLNWPCGDATGPFPVKIIHEMDKVDNVELPGYAWLHHGVAYGAERSEIPVEVLDMTPGIPIVSFGAPVGTGLRGTSDHASFGRVDVPNVFLGGFPATIVNGDASDHSAAAMTYPLHTPLDTLQAMEARCTDGTLAGGLQTIADLFAHTLTWLATNEA